MSVLEIQHLIDVGKLNEALQVLNTTFSTNYFEYHLYSSFISLKNGKFQLCVDFATQAYNIAKDLDLKVAKSSAAVSIAYGLQKLGKFDESIRLLDEAEMVFSQIARNIEDPAMFWYALIFQVRGGINAKFGDIYQSIQSFKQALDLFLPLRMKGTLSGIYNNIGYSLTLIGKSQEAFSYYQKSLELANEIDSPYQKYFPHSNLGLYYFNIGDLEKAEKHHNIALDIAQSIGHDANVASQYRDISQIYRIKGNLNQALVSLQLSLELRRAIGNPIWIMFTLIYLVELCIEMSKQELLLDYKDQMEVLSNENQSNKLLNQISQMARAEILKSKTRIGPKVEAMDIFRTIANGEILDYDTTLNAILHLCELLFFEIRITNQNDGLEEINELIKRLDSFITQGNSQIIFGDLLCLKANIAILNGDLDNALKLYESALQRATEFGSSRLNNKIHELKGLLIQAKEQSDPFDTEFSIRMEMINIEAYLQEILKIKDNLSQK